MFHINIDGERVQYMMDAYAILMIQREIENTSETYFHLRHIF